MAKINKLKFFLCPFTFKIFFWITNFSFWYSLGLLFIGIDPGLNIITGFCFSFMNFIFYYAYRIRFMPTFIYKFIPLDDYWRDEISWVFDVIILVLIIIIISLVIFNYDYMSTKFEYIIDYVIKELKR
jgi:hypothetical protein